MSYVFSKINSTLNPDEENQSSTNIFAQPADGQASQGGESAGLGVPKTSTETGIMSAGGSGSTGTAAEGQPVQMQAADSRVMKRNIGKVSTPDLATQIGSNLSKADQDLQTESNEYMAGANTKAGTYGVDDATLNSAVGGDADAMGKTQTTLRGDAVDYEDFIPKTQYEFDDVQNLSSSRGLQSLLKNEARGQLSGKELEFDRGILERSPEFLKIREALKGQQSALSQKGAALSGITGTNTKAAQAAIDAGISGAKTAAETGLGSIDAQLRSKNQGQVDERNKHLASLRAAGVPADIASQVADAKAGLAGRTDDSLRLDDMLKNSKVDGKDYLSFDNDATFDQMIDSDEAMKFNNIMQLLGRGGQSAVAGKGVGPDYSLNKAELEKAILSDANLNRKTTDGNLNSEMENIKAAIEAQVASANEDRASQYEAYKQGILKDLPSQYEAMRNGGQGFNNLNFDQFFSGPGQVGFDNLVSEKDAARMNEIEKSLGGQGRYKAGSNDMSKVDMAAIQKYMQEQAKIGIGGRPITPRGRNSLDEINKFFVDIQPKNVITKVGNTVSRGVDRVSDVGASSKKKIAAKNPLSKKNKRW